MTLIFLYGREALRCFCVNEVYFLRLGEFEQNDHRRPLTGSERSAGSDLGSPLSPLGVDCF